ncbi:MAG: excinuclease ABC subunit UvrC [Magnetococcales bacterium]|nr:excinuclease ABC subunit UvrC [Magnetococcales bacterium]MBF0438282.1 excinuclease ABC subunit UvrC [Magnetococcales bacterium]
MGVILSQWVKKNPFFINGELREAVESLPDTPGVYRFLDATGKVLYVGKAKSLKKRVTSYFHVTGSPRTLAMLSKARDLAIVVTPTENDALILEANLIRQLQPPYNVLLKDDKSHPWLRLTLDHPFPRLLLYRGPRQGRDRYFGPYPSVQAVRTTLKWLHTIFPLRQCEDKPFASRQRPCLQHQIKRCQAPCMGLTDQETYGQWVKDATLFLEGRDHQLIETMTRSMWEASNQRNFEQAAQLRDRLKAITHVQSQRRLNLAETSDIDVICATTSRGPTSIELFFIRHGVNLGNQSHFPENTEDLEPVEALEAFISQYYAARVAETGSEGMPIPPEILVNLPLAETAWLEAALVRIRCGPVHIRLPQKGEKKRLLDLCLANAESAKLRHMSGKRANRLLLAELATVLEMPSPPERIEAFDVSHMQDAHVVASMAVFGPEGLMKRAYRRFSIKNPASMDDTSRMAEVLARRFKSREQGEELGEEGAWPDLVLLDGGKGQLNAVMQGVAQRELVGVTFCAMAKGEDRHAGRESLFLPGRQEPIILPERSAVLFLLQNIRDEAHRFAVTYHRSKREHAQVRSVLDRIPGVGPTKKRDLLRRFGSVRSIREACVEDLTAVPGISAALAQAVIGHLQDCQETI